MSCGVDDVFHFEGEPQRCFYCLDPLRLALSSEIWWRCVGCGLQYTVALLEEYGTERILSQPDQYHISRLDVASMADPGPRPVVTITNLDTARSVLAERGDL